MRSPVLLLVVTTACSQSASRAGDDLAGNPADSSLLPDLAAGDGAAGDLGGQDLSLTCVTYQVVEPPNDVAALDGEANLRGGAAIRLVVRVAGTCIIPADAVATVQPGNATDFVQIRARAWQRGRRDASDCLESEVYPTVLALGQRDGLSSPNLSVRTTDPMGPVLRFAVGPPPQGAKCEPAAALGAACALDCQCEASDARARCIPTGAATAVCAISCSEDVDCPAALPRCRAAGTPPFTCVNVPRAAADGCKERWMNLPFDCRGPKDCSEGLCRVHERAIGGACRCEGECSFALCTAGDICVVPCQSLADCPRTASTCREGSCL